MVGTGALKEIEAGVEDVADHRPAVYREDGKWVFRASTFGACDASLVREALGQVPAPPPDVILKAYAEGVRHEAAILQAFREGTCAGSDGSAWVEVKGLRAEKFGPFDSTGQRVCDLVVGPRAIVRCHPDAIVQCYRAYVAHGPPGPIVPVRWKVGDWLFLEAKALSTSFSNPLAKPQYRWQLAIEAAATGLEGQLVVGWKEEGELVRVEAITPVGLPGLGAIKARARHLVKLVEAGERGVVPACDWAMWPCGFWQVHDTSEGSVHHKGGEALGDEDERHARAWVFKWRTAKKMKESWAAKEGEARDALQALMEAAGVVRWGGGGAMATYHEPGVRAKFNVAKAKDDGVEVSKYMDEVPVKAFVRVTDQERQSQGQRDEGRQP